LQERAACDVTVKAAKCRVFQRCRSN